MTTKRIKRTNSGATVTKWFITAASVAAMLGGWAVFSSEPPTSKTDLASQTMAIGLGLEPIPTLVPTREVRQNGILSNQETTNTQTSLPTLRSVSAPQPKPVTVTRSSR